MSNEISKAASGKQAKFIFKKGEQAKPQQAKGKVPQLPLYNMDHFEKTNQS